MRQRLRAPIAWAVVVFLSLVGVAIVAPRASFPDDAVVRFQPQRQRLLEAIGRPDVAAAARLPELERFDQRFAQRRALTRWHIFSGGLFIVLAPFQLAIPLRH